MLPVEIEEIILYYKHKFEHFQKIKNLNIELYNNIYYCRGCLKKNHETVTKIFFICNLCKEPIGMCCYKHHGVYCNNYDCIENSVDYII